MDRDMKFVSLMRDTESNLQRVKERLGSARESISEVYSFTGYSYRPTSNSKAAGKTETNSGAVMPYNEHIHRNTYNNPMSYSVPGAKSIMYSDFPSHHYSGDVFSGTQLENSPGALMVLHDKLESQAKMMQELGLKMRSIEEERNQYYRQVHSLKDELSVINLRMSEKGVDLATERKIDVWRRETMHEVQSLQAQVQHLRNRNDDYSQSTAHADLLREIHSTRRFIQDECDSIRREMDAMKTRILKLEVNYNNVTSETRNLGRSYDKLNTMYICQEYAQQDYYSSTSDILSTIKEVEEEHIKSKMTVRELQQVQFTNPRPLFKLGDGRKQMSNIRGSLQEMESKLSFIEDKVNQEKADKPKKNLKSTTFKSRSRSPADLLSAGSDLDLSSTADFTDLQTTDLSLSPTHKGYTFSEDFGDLTLDTDDILSSALDLDDLTTYND